MKILVALALGAAALFFVFHCVNVRQELLAERQAIDADWSGVEAALVHRAVVTSDLTRTVAPELPNETAVATVNEAHDLLEQARDRHAKMAANARLDESIARLMLVIETYPKIEKSKPYAGLLEALKGAEYQIAVARRKYNEAVEHYNARIELFPANIVASISGMHKVDAYFQTPVL